MFVQHSICWDPFTLTTSNELLNPKDALAYPSMIDRISCMNIHISNLLHSRAYVGQTNTALQYEVSEHKAAIHTGRKKKDYKLDREAQRGSPTTPHFIELKHVTPPARGDRLPKLPAQREQEQERERDFYT